MTITVLFFLSIETSAKVHFYCDSQISSSSSLVGKSQKSILNMGKVIPHPACPACPAVAVALAVAPGPE
jgi:hypothetical protein